MSDTPKGPFRLVTVNTAPERARRLIGRMIEALKDRYTIIHVDNCESEQKQPILFQRTKLTSRRNRGSRAQGQGASAGRAGRYPIPHIHAN